MIKKSYIKPEIIRVDLDYTISILMGSQPHDPPPDGPSGKSGGGANTPFASPFGDKPFG
jgi:hypothetical protein